MKNEFFTEVSWQGIPLESRARYSHGLLSLGSCFSDNIGNWLLQHQFDISVNPFGTLYNPLSLARALNILADESFHFTPQHLFYDGERYRSFMHHSRYSDTQESVALEQMNCDLEVGREKLLRGNWLFLTLGTSFYYELRETGEVVANCHKCPAGDFRQLRLSAEQSTQALLQALIPILQRNEQLRLLITVSPIRYRSYGAVENMRSKADLLRTAEQIEGVFPSRAYYFPAFEIMLDELRDYRFYARDLVHPSELAIDLIRQKLLAGWLHPDENPHEREAEKNFRRSQHRPLL